MRHSVIALLLACLAASVGAAEERPLPRLEVHEPRAYGHVLGDVLERRIEVELPSGTRLVEKSVPKPGRAGRWLELQAVEASRTAGVGSHRFEIILAYQIVNAPREVLTLALPEVTLELSGGTLARLTVPEWPFTAGPLTPTTILARGPLDEMQPDAPPKPISTSAVATRLAAYAVAGGVLALFLFYQLWGIPFLARSRGPFARAHRQVKMLAGRDDAGAVRDALREIHRALDEWAGRAVFSRELEALLSQRPKFAPLEADLERFFEISRREFFGEGADEPGVLPWLEALCRRCRNIERGSA